MKNHPIGEHEGEDLRKQVRKVLRGLGEPEPPLDLRDVRELLRLDLRYYSSEDDSYLREMVSRIKVGGKQLLLRPALLLDVVKKAKLSALWVPDHKRILIDADAPKLKHRWFEGHEIGHGLAPWHRRYLFGDDAETLRLTCYERLESEANYAAGQLLFLQERFSEEANDLPTTLESVRQLHKTFGNTMTSTLWRFVEDAHPDLPMVGIVSRHPHRAGKDFDPETPCKYCIESPAFRTRFSGTDEVKFFSIIKDYTSRARGGPLGSAEVLLTDGNGDRHAFHFESFFNRYEALTLGVYLRPADPIVSVL